MTYAEAFDLPIGFLNFLYVKTKKEENAKLKALDKNKKDLKNLSASIDSDLGG